MNPTAPFDRLKVRDGWVVAAILAISLLATSAGYIYEKNQSQTRAKLIFEDRSRIVKKDLQDTLGAYGHFLRGGVALFIINDQVTRKDWHDYVAHLNLAENYPGIQGVSFNVILRTSEALERFEKQVQQQDLPTFKVRPEADRDLYVPVLYLEPLTARNERAIGFDIYSEDRRRAAIDRALTTGEASLTEKITLVQEDVDGGPDQVQSGVLLMLPIFGEQVDFSSDRARSSAATGLIVSVFRMGDLVNSILSKQGLGTDELVQVRLYDSAINDPNAVLFETPTFDTATEYSTQDTFEVFGRQWTFQTYSTANFDLQSRTYAEYILLGCGIMISLLLATLAWGQAARNREMLRTTAVLESSNSKIALLMAEINHRSKNLLGLVQAIAHQTSSGNNPNEFAKSFSQRLSALASNQDLLAKNEWKQISLKDLVNSQLAHFKGLVGGRISLRGDYVPLSAETAQTMGMAIHELSTNASKYGALSNDKGTIDIKWDFVKAEENKSIFRFSWVERHGPLVTSPIHKGFGSKVTGIMVKLSLSGEIETRFDAHGFTWRLQCPSKNIMDESESGSQEPVNA